MLVLQCMGEANIHNCASNMFYTYKLEHPPLLSTMFKTMQVVSVSTMQYCTIILYFRGNQNTSNNSTVLTQNSSYNYLVLPVVSIISTYTVLIQTHQGTPLSTNCKSQPCTQCAYTTTLSQYVHGNMAPHSEFPLYLRCIFCTSNQNKCNNQYHSTTLA